jgi:hypothetical protein
MQADCRAVASDESADRVSTPHNGPDGECRLKRLVARHEATRVRDREHGPVDDHADEEDDTVIGGDDDTVGCCGDVDSAMPRSVGGSGRDEGSHDGVGRIDRPHPSGCRSRRGMRRRGRRETQGHDEQGQDRQDTKPGTLGGREREQHSRRVPRRPQR